MCADEMDCSYERATLCAWAAVGDSLDAQVQFLECMDAQGKLPLFYNDTAPRNCCEKQSIPWNVVQKCFNGKQGDSLVAASQARVMQAFGSKNFYLPNVQVDGTTVCTSDKCDYQAVSSHLTKASLPKPFLANNSELSEKPSIEYYFASL